MQQGKKITLTVLWASAVLGMIGVVTTGVLAYRFAGSGGENLPVLYDAPKFSLIDQYGKTITDADLRGNIWVTIVFFASCPGVCPVMSARMAQLQKTIDLKDMKIVSLTVDPEHDTPEVLRQYAEGLEADQSRWHLLSGPKETMFEVAKGFKLAAAPAQDGMAITHTQKALLIDRGNHVRGIYDATDTESMKKLAEDVKVLAAQ